MVYGKQSMKVYTNLLACSKIIFSIENFVIAAFSKYTQSFNFVIWDYPKKRCSTGLFDENNQNICSREREVKGEGTQIKVHLIGNQSG